MKISKRRIALDGLTVGALFTVVVVTTLAFDPALWLEDYPPDVRAAAGDAAGVSAAWKAAAGLGILAVVLGGLVWSFRRVDREVGGLDPLGASLHAFGLFWVVALVDVVVVDWLFFMSLLGDRVVLPGTEGLAGYEDHLFHLRRGLLEPEPWAASLILAAGSGVGWWLLVARHRRSGLGSQSDP